MSKEKEEKERVKEEPRNDPFNWIHLNIIIERRFVMGWDDFVGTK